jgi:Zn-dependent proteases
MNFDLTTILLLAVPLILGITLHEAAHGYVARMYGDRTAEMMGRITLNPIKHIDPIGTLLVPGVMLLMAKATGIPLVFGWAKPVPVNASNLKDPIRNMRWVAAAGPLSNLVMAFAWAIVLKIGSYIPGEYASGLVLMAVYGISINVLLMVLNLMPILPLDGGRILYSFLPWKWAMQFRRIEPWGIWILLFLLITDILWVVMRPIMNFVTRVIALITGL